MVVHHQRNDRVRCAVWMSVEDDRRGVSAPAHVADAPACMAHPGLADTANGGETRAPLKVRVVTMIDTARTDGCGLIQAVDRQTITRGL